MFAVDRKKPPNWEACCSSSGSFFKDESLPLGEGKKEGEEKQVCIHHIHSPYKQCTLINLMLLFLSIKKRAQIGRVRDKP
ncbi:hypothetical protein VY86_01505 [Photorhabdus thracensis]|uniref:Uncharacterized protein n=1 Tax=Photorhabdus thracensis TaxID=230089 RepID=A0A0F7LHU6_9GAMM|nr:hypothetical protein VY86_01505 [Photorhabdus thracensis]